MAKNGGRKIEQKNGQFVLALNHLLVKGLSSSINELLANDASASDANSVESVQKGCNNWNRSKLSADEVIVKTCPADDEQSDDDNDDDDRKIDGRKKSN